MKVCYGVKKIKLVEFSDRLGGGRESELLMQYHYTV